MGDKKNMKYKYYPNTIKFITERLRKKFSKVKPEEGLENIPDHLLWMMSRMQSFDDSAKVGRWIGWIIAHAEILGIITNKQSCKLAKKDSRERFV